MKPHLVPALSLLALAACASTPDTASGADGAGDADALQAHVPGLDGCKVKVNDGKGRTVLCGPHLGALVPAGKEDAQEIIDTFVEGMAQGAGTTVEREPADRDIAGTIASGTHVWFTNKSGALVDGWLGVVTAGGERRLVGCLLLGESISDRCPQLLKLLRDGPLLAAGRYPVSVLGATTQAPDACDIAPNRASCGTYELQWYEDGASLPVDRFVDRFVQQGSTVAARTAPACKALDGAASCEKVKLQASTGNVDITFAYPASGGVLLCIVEENQPLQPMCASVMRVEEG